MSSVSAYAYPRAFYCEHNSSKSRVYVLTESGGSQMLRAVLTTSNPELAERAASLLTGIVDRGTSADATHEVDRLAIELANAPAASFREAVTRAAAQRWPLDNSDTSPRGNDGAPLWDLTPTDKEQSDGRHVTPWSRDEDERTPSDAHLRDLSGTVVRIFSLYEFHVHDPGRLFAAARADGWVPDEDDDLDERDHVLDASMWLTHVDIPAGADFVTEAAEGQCLDPDLGEEVSDWSREQLVANFGSGWRTRQTGPDGFAQSSKHGS